MFSKQNQGLIKCLVFAWEMSRKDISIKLLAGRKLKGVGFSFILCVRVCVLFCFVFGENEARTEGINRT